MKIEEACKKAGCAEGLSCFGGKDETMEHPLCFSTLLRLLNSYIEAGKFSHRDLEELLEFLKSSELEITDIVKWVEKIWAE